MNVKIYLIIAVVVFISSISNPAYPAKSAFEKEKRESRVAEEKMRISLSKFFDGLSNSVKNNDPKKLRAVLKKGYKNYHYRPNFKIYYECPKGREFSVSQYLNQCMERKRAPKGYPTENVGGGGPVIIEALFMAEEIFSFDSVMELIRAGADPRAKDVDGKDGFYYQFGMPILQGNNSYLNSKKIQVIDYFIGLGLPVGSDLVDQEGISLLHKAAAIYPKAVIPMLEAGYDHRLVAPGSFFTNALGIAGFSAADFLMARRHVLEVNMLDDYIRAELALGILEGREPLAEDDLALKVNSEIAKSSGDQVDLFVKYSDLKSLAEEVNYNISVCNTLRGLESYKWYESCFFKTGEKAELSLQCSTMFGQVKKALDDDIANWCESSKTSVDVLVEKLHADDVYRFKSLYLAERNENIVMKDAYYRLADNLVTLVDREIREKERIVNKTKEKIPLGQIFALAAGAALAGKADLSSADSIQFMSSYAKDVIGGTTANMDKLQNDLKTDRSISDMMAEFNEKIARISNQAKSTQAKQLSSKSGDAQMETSSVSTSPNYSVGNTVNPSNVSTSTSSCSMGELVGSAKAFRESVQYSVFHQKSGMIGKPEEYYRQNAMFTNDFSNQARSQANESCESRGMKLRDQSFFGADVCDGAFRETRSCVLPVEFTCYTSCNGKSLGANLGFGKE